MIFNKNEIESSIQYDEDLNLYSVKLAWIQRKFEAVFYSYKNIQKSYLKNIDQELIEQNFKIENTIIGITKAFDYYIVCFISLDTLESNYYFLESFELFNFNIWPESYYGFVYKNTDWEVLYKTNFKKNKQFEISIIKGEFLVKNIIFNTEIYNKNISHITQNNNIENNSQVKAEKIDQNKYVDIADIFVYNDLFINNNSDNYLNYYSFLEKIQDKINKNKKIAYKINIFKYTDTYSPIFKINLQVEKDCIAKFKNSDIMKLLLCFFTESMTWYFIDIKEVKNFLSENILDITDIDIEEIITNFELPENILSTDINYKKIQVNLLKLRHNLFFLKENYALIEKLEDDNLKNENIDVSKLRINLDKQTLNHTIKIYEENLNNFLNKLTQSL